MSPALDDDLPGDEPGAAPSGTVAPPGPTSAPGDRTKGDGPGGEGKMPGRRLVPAGQIIGVGLVCFLVWLLLDARQLYANAFASPQGTRRSVAMTVLRPIVRVEDVFGLDRIVDGANRVLGRPSSGPGRSTSALGAPPPTTPPTSPPGGAGRSTLGPPARTPGRGTLGPPAPGTRAVGRPHHSGPPSLAQPSAAKPLSLLEVGDSLGVDLGNGLDNVLGNDPKVVLHTEAVIDTGLANVAYYNWPATLAKELKADHPGLVVVFLGGNDAQSFENNGHPAEFGTAYWHAAYSARVEEMMNEATRAGAHVLWVGMPVMSPASGLSPAMAKLDAIYKADAAGHPDVRYLSTWRLFETPSGQFATFLPNASGNEVAVRDPDGVHLAPPGGEDLVANAVVKAVWHDWHVHL